LRAYFGSIDLKSTGEDSESPRYKTNAPKSEKKAVLCAARRSEGSRLLLWLRKALQADDIFKKFVINSSL
jgi:hypothetical protein